VGIGLFCVLGYLLIAGLVGYLSYRWIRDDKGDEYSESRSKDTGVIMGMFWFFTILVFILVVLPYWIIGKFLELFKLLFESGKSK
jgi:hypothetical protein